MGGNIETGMMEMLDDEKRRALFETDFHGAVDRMMPGDMHAEDRERRHDEGPPIFRVGEVLEIRGGKYRVGRIGKRGMILRPVKG